MFWGGLLIMAALMVAVWLEYLVMFLDWKIYALLELKRVRATGDAERIRAAKERNKEEPWLGVVTGPLELTVMMATVGLIALPLRLYGYIRYTVFGQCPRS